MSFARALLGLSLIAPLHARADAPQPSTALSDGFRCRNGRLVDVGESSATVLSRCGKPDHAERHAEDRPVACTPPPGSGRDASSHHLCPPVRVTIDTWIYVLGGGSFDRILRFEDTRLISVELGERH